MTEKQETSKLATLQFPVIFNGKDNTIEIVVNCNSQKVKVLEGLDTIPTLKWQAFKALNGILEAGCSQLGQLKDTPQQPKKTVLTNFIVSFDINFVDADEITPDELQKFTELFSFYYARENFFQWLNTGLNDLVSLGGKRAIDWLNNTAFVIGCHA